MANIAEGHGKSTEDEFANFLNIARGPSVELQSHLYVLLDLNQINEPQFREMYELLGDISKMNISLSKYLRNKNSVNTGNLVNSKNSIN